MPGPVDPVISKKDQTGAPRSPHEGAIRELARVAKIPDEARGYFFSLIIEAVEAADEERDVKRLRTLSPRRNRSFVGSGVP